MVRLAPIKHDSVTKISSIKGQGNCISNIRKKIFKRNGKESDVQHAIVKLLISKTFGSQRKKSFPGKIFVNSISLSKYCLSDSSGVDGDIYFPDQDEPEVKITIQPRSETMDNLAKTVLKNTSDYNRMQYSLPNTFDRFPFSSRPPQFDPSKAPSQVPVPSSPPHAKVYNQASKVIAQSKPSLSNPNVLFCKPDEMARTIIY